MRRLQSFAVAVGLVFSTTLIAGSNNASAQGIEALPRDVEMELASSALPAHLQEAATIYVLDPHKGFVVARKGTNGFHALVARTGDDAFRGSWPLTEYPPDVLYPVSFDAAGARAHMQVYSRKRCRSPDRGLGIFSESRILHAAERCFGRGADGWKWPVLSCPQSPG